MVNKTQRMVFHIIAAALNQGSMPDWSGIGEKDLEAIYQEIRAQSLLPLTWRIIAKSPFHECECAGKWKQAMAAQTYRWYGMMEAQREILDLLKGQGFQAAVLKGTANGVYYPTPQLRVSSDVDLLVGWEDYDRIYELLVSYGFRPAGEKQEGKHHFAVVKNGVMFEVHKRPGGTRLHGTKEQVELIRFFQEGLEKIEMIDSCGYTVPMLPPLHHAMVLLLHTAQHMREGIGLRHILDWMMFAEHHVSDEFWREQLQPMAKKGQVEQLALVLTKMCQKYLGMSKNLTWCEAADERLCDELMNYLLQQGDFGSRAGQKDAETRVLTESQSTGGFFRRLNESSLYSMPAARKYKVLRPLAWSYQLGRYLYKGMRREHPLRNFLKHRNQAKSRSSLFENLGLMK